MGHAFYKIIYGSSREREEVENWLGDLTYLNNETKEKVITAWVTSWLNSGHQSLFDVVYAPETPDHKLQNHVREVLKFGVSLAQQAIEQWQTTIDMNELASILLLHDVDKPLIYSKTDEGWGYSPLFKQVQHGVLGAFILKDLGFSEKVISTVSLHAVNSPFHGSTLEACILSYADLFSSDYILMNAGLKPYYQRK